MRRMETLGKALVFTGLAIAAAGAVLWLGRGLPWLRLGRLPGDFAYQRDGVSVFVPITTMILLSLAATGLYWLIGALRR